MQNLFIIILLLSTGYSQSNIECWGNLSSWMLDIPEGIFTDTEDGTC